jgi:hypothetical protein
MPTEVIDGISYDFEDDIDMEGVDAFTNHFLKRTDAEKAIRKSAPEVHADEDEHSPEDDHVEDAHEDDEPSEDDESDDSEDERQYAEGDNLFVRVKVGEETHEVSVKDLQRLYGQEASLTQKGQQLANQRKAAEQNEAYHLAASQAMLKNAQDRWAPYAQIDFLALSRDERISHEQFQALREEAAERYNELQFLQTNANDYVQNLQSRQGETMKAAAVEAVKHLTDDAGPYHIADWSDATYDSIRNYAVKGGMNKGIVDSIVDPAAIKLLHKAMLYDQGQSKVKTEKVGNKVTKVVKTSRTMSSGQRTGKSNKSAEQRLAQTGSIDDATAAFLGRYQNMGINE